MIRTHKPTGHHWTCASHFQQSKQYRNLDAQDWDPPHAKALVTDPDDKLPVASRVAKRQKVETLANDFLEGKPLFISSACANGLELTATVDKVLFEKKLDWDELVDDYDPDLWADGEDGWTALRKRSKARAVLKSTRTRSKSSRQSAVSRTVEASRVVETPFAPGRRLSTTLRPKVSTAPSEDALARAAELRARKVSLVAKTAERPEALLPVIGQVTHSAPPTARATSSFRQCTSSRPFDPTTPAETTMADELRLSRTDSPSHRPRAFTLPVESFSSETTVEDELEQLAPSEPITYDSTAMELCTAEQNIPSSHLAATTAPTARSQSTAIASKMNSTWTPINDKQAQRPNDMLNTHGAISSGFDLLSTTTSVAASSAMKLAKTPKTRSAAKSTPQGTARSPHKKATLTPGDDRESSQRSNQSRLTSSFKTSKSEHITVEKSQNGSTPFVYRKKTRASKDKDANSTDDEFAPDEQRRSLPSAQVTPKPRSSSAFPSVSAAPPTLDKSFEQVSSLGPALNMALVGEHVNKKLPNSPGSARRSSSVKKALRSEMRLSGADLSRAPGEPSSSQPMEDDNNSPATAGVYEDHSAATRQVSKRRSIGQWPGTQVLLSKAQHDLFMSPDKVTIATAAAPSELEDHSHLTELDQPGDMRRPLRQLSQECLPGTQALMNDWSPWSTVKKAKPGKRASFAPSPLVAKDKSSPVGTVERSLRSGSKTSLPTGRLPEAKQRRSSLRFSTSTAETPLPPQRKEPANTASEITTSRSTDLSAVSPNRNGAMSQSIYGPTPGTAASKNITFDFSAISFATTAARDVTDLDDSMADWDAHDQASSFHNAQRPSSGPSPEAMMNELATEFLSTADIDGVLGKL